MQAAYQIGDAANMNPVTAEQRDLLDIAKQIAAEMVINDINIIRTDCCYSHERVSALLSSSIYIYIYIFIYP